MLYTPLIRHLIQSDLSDTSSDTVCFCLPCYILTRFIIWYSLFISPVLYTPLIRHKIQPVYISCVIYSPDSSSDTVCLYILCYIPPWSVISYSLFLLPVLYTSLIRHLIQSVFVSRVIYLPDSSSHTVCFCLPCYIPPWFVIWYSLFLSLCYMLLWFVNSYSLFLSPVLYTPLIRHLIQSVYISCVIYLPDSSSDTVCLYFLCYIPPWFVIWYSLFLSPVLYTPLIRHLIQSVSVSVLYTPLIRRLIQSVPVSVLYTSLIRHLIQSVSVSVLYTFLIRHLIQSVFVSRVIYLPDSSSHTVCFCLPCYIPPWFVIWYSLFLSLCYMLLWFVNSYSLFLSPVLYTPLIRHLIQSVYISCVIYLPDSSSDTVCFCLLCYILPWFVISYSLFLSLCYIAPWFVISYSLFLSLCYIPPWFVISYSLFLSLCYIPPWFVIWYSLFLSLCYIPSWFVISYSLFLSLCYIPPWFVISYSLFLSLCYIPPWFVISYSLFLSPVLYTPLIRHLIQSVYIPCVIYSPDSWSHTVFLYLLCYILPWFVISYSLFMYLCYILTRFIIWYSLFLSPIPPQLVI